MDFLVWLILSIALVIGFHFALSFFGSGGSKLAQSIHIARRIQHCFTGFIILGLYGQLGHQRGVWVCLAATVMFTVFDRVRLLIPQWNDWLVREWRWLMRPHELHSPVGSVYFLWGASAVLVLTENSAIVYMSVLTLSVCDPVASMCGIYFGGPKLIGQKSVAGSLGVAFSSLLIAVLYTWASGQFVNPLAAIAVAILAELVTVPWVDDNLTIPMLCCLQYQALNYLGLILL